MMNGRISVPEIQEIIRSHPRIVARGGGSKTALQLHRDGVELVDLTGLQGLLEYQPEEFTFTAWAGSYVADVQQILGEHDQFLPFDPVLVERGATLGGTVASGLSGPGRYRFGGLRDFLLGVKFVDGLGNLVRSGGRVVKNAAGFDLSKFMVGSLGEYGVLVELTFKVFPRPIAYTTLGAEYPSLAAALQALARLTATPLELFAVELQPLDNGCVLLVRLGGRPETFAPRLERLRGVLEGLSDKPQDYFILQEAAETETWRSLREFQWVDSGLTLVKVPLTPRCVLPLDERLTASGAQRRYSVGANLAWIAWPGPILPLHDLLASQGLSGLAVLGRAEKPFVGVSVGEPFARRVKQALDPLGKFSV